MAVERIERIINGVVVRTAEPASQYVGKGQYRCRAYRETTEEWGFANLDDAAAFLRANPGASIRMNPKWAKVSRHIYIDGVPLRDEKQSEA